MDEKYMIYTEVKRPPCQKKVKKDKKNEQLIYSEVRTYPKNSNQRKKTKTEPPKGKGSLVPLAWYLAVVILGILCFFLLVTTAVFGIMVLQGHQTSQSQNPSLNATQCKCISENKGNEEKQLNSGPSSNTCKAKWLCCGEKCYFFSPDTKNFQESKKFCREMGSTLLKIEDKKELNFIQSHLSYFYWIGLFRAGTNSPWTWEDKSAPFLRMDWKESQDGNCACLAARKIAAHSCSQLRKFICEKRITCLPT
ncbi:C-type lectin domain family 7 member A-like [Erinaceus europaeus]|uniref:C-type lectin domain family 7 member A-like n=1 Tax=Erinaceus europaeus TaxID=9365 RepID=A0ABM3XKS5_ERIEU|nr:C-type lectin domain family 7 member A-like [Erinaceus europaeus]